MQYCTLPSISHVKTKYLCARSVSAIEWRVASPKDDGIQQRQ